VLPPEKILATPMNRCHDSAILHAPNFEQNWPTCAELTKRHRNCEILQIIFSNIVFSLTLMVATAASAKHFGVKVTWR